MLGPLGVMSAGNPITLMTKNIARINVSISLLYWNRTVSNVNIYYVWHRMTNIKNSFFPQSCGKLNMLTNDTTYPMIDNKHPSDGVLYYGYN